MKELIKNGVKGSVIGEVTKKGRFLIDNSKKIEIKEPESDELYKVIT